MENAESWDGLVAEYSSSLSKEKEREEVFSNSVLWSPNLQKLFNAILEGGPKKVFFHSKLRYESTRVNLLRKFKNYTGLLDFLGGPNLFEQQFLKCSWNPEEKSGTFSIVEKEKGQHHGPKNYNVLL